MAKGFVWQSSPADVFPAMLTAYERYVRDVVYYLWLRRAPEIESWMKDNAPWTDRTGNARQSLTAEVLLEGTSLVVLQMRYGNGVEYAKYLEYSNSGRFSILAPTLDHFLPIVFGDVQAFARSL